jgi:hypothetical protein
VGQKGTRVGETASSSERTEINHRENTGRNIEKEG